VQLAIDYEAPVFLGQKLSCQQEAILRYLQAGKTLTVAEALSELGVYALSQRCGELKRLGWPIKSEMVRTPSGKHVARYSLESA
jgi:hypothetical protein